MEANKIEPFFNKLNATFPAIEWFPKAPASAEAIQVEILVKSDIQIPAHIYDEAAELFQNHLREYYEAQLLKDEYPRVNISLEQSLKKNTRMIRQLQLNYLGRTCPLYYKKNKGLDSVARPYQNRT